MENALDAMKMAFGMIVFVLALSASMYLLNTATNTSRILLYYADETNYLDNINIRVDPANPDADLVVTRTVNVETIIPTLYRYYKENFAVHIYNNSGNLVQIFDVNIEGKVRKAAGTTAARRTDEQIALLSLYGKASPLDSKNPYLFEAPWIGNTNKDIKTRIDLFVKGECSYINGTKVDYTHNNLLGNFAGSRFTEEFISYTYKGDTIASADGTETITGTAKPEDKIVIIYREI